MQQHYIVLVYGVLVYLYGVGAVLLIIGFANCLGRQLSGLAHRHKSCTQFHCERCTHDEAARLDTYHFCDAAVLVHFVERVVELLHAFGTLEERCYIAEQYSGDGKIVNRSKVF